MIKNIAHFDDLLKEVRSRGGLTNTRITKTIRSLLVEVNSLHELGLGPIFNRTESIIILDNKMYLGEYTATKLKDNHKSLPLYSKQNTNKSPLIYTKGKPITTPLFVQGYDSYEKMLGHHDTQTDIFILGLLLASLGLGLNFEFESDIQKFVEYKYNISLLNPKLHPEIAHLILEMTHFDRQKRPSTLDEVITRIDNYNDYNSDQFVDILETEGFIKINESDKKSYILSRLKNQLFDTSRRNHLFHYKNLKKYLNLTELSLPKNMEDIKGAHEKLLIWNKTVSRKIEKQQDIYLDICLQGKNAKTSINRLKTLKREARKGINEYGFNPLKLVINFLHWTREDEIITSPLMLIPVSIKKDGVQLESYSLQINSNEAEINPILVYYFKSKYKIILPDYIDLSKVNINQFQQHLQTLVSQQLNGIRVVLNNGIPLQKITPNIVFEESQSFISDSIKTVTSCLNVINEVIYLEKEQITEYQLNQNFAKSATPYQWTINTNMMVIGNFNYKKISLVKDYEEISDTQINNDIFDTLFTYDYEELNKIELPPFVDQYHTYKVDNSQLEAIHTVHQNNTNFGLIIQGPPGTGKSQTITNLIADLTARGKRTLFVCDKRAALDIVYKKLKQCGLSQYATIIHDAQLDKKPFIMDLKASFESIKDNDTCYDDLQHERKRITDRLSFLKNKLEQDKYKMSRGIGQHNLSFYQLLERQLVIKDEKISSYNNPELDYSHWTKNKEIILALNKGFQNIESYKSYSLHPFRFLNVIYLKKSVSKESLQSQLLTLKGNINRILSLGKKYPNIFDASIDIKAFGEHVNTSFHLKHLLKGNNKFLLNKNSDTYQLYTQLLQKNKALNSKLAHLITLNVSWTNKIPKIQLEAAIVEAKVYESDTFSFIKPSNWRFKKWIKSQYNFSKDKLKKSPLEVLINLKDLYKVEGNHKLLIKQINNNFQTDQIEEIHTILKTVENSPQNPIISTLKSDHINGLELIESLYSFEGEIEKLKYLIDESSSTTKLLTLKNKVDQILLNIDDWPTVKLPILALSTLTPTLQKTLKNITITPAAFEKSLLENEIVASLETQPSFSKNKNTQNEIIHKELLELYDNFLKINSKYIAEKINAKLYSMVKLTSTSHAKLDDQSKTAKIKLKEGLLPLKREMSKKIRHRSIRDLASNEAKPWIDNMKPIWLMSPLSVADTLPLNSNLFDVVIFDESSQIPLADGIPSIYRARKAIIVGDDMQLPPTQYFKNNQEVESEDIGIVSTSLLSQAIDKIPSTTLNWHYRSKSESLINFSNAAFYNNQLKTIPSPTPHFLNKSNKCKLHQGIQSHYIEDGVYSERCNHGEANYIADLVQDYIDKYPGKSIGIVAFSRQQQSIIEKAIDRLANMNPLFQEQLSEKTNQIEGLFVKNLENVQGDERDIMIISICYGFNKKRKFRLNFGPINREGGKKRLNVIFTRAKEHLSIVSSIKSENITNTYNEGALHLKLYLKYAESISEGNNIEAQHVIDNFTGEINKQPSTSNALQNDIFDSLIKLGYMVDKSIGQSIFKCDLAILDDKGQQYKLGILLDSNKNNFDDHWEQQFFKPEILKSFGWNIIRIYALDWYKDSEKEMARIIKLIQ